MNIIQKYISVKGVGNIEEIFIESYHLQKEKI